MESSSQPPKHQLLLRAGVLASLGWLLAGIALWVFIEGVATANRPHEVSGGWAVATLAAIDLVLAVLVTVLLVRNTRRDGL